MYKAIDYMTDETIIVSNDKEKVNKAVNEWVANGGGSGLVAIFKDDEMIYP